MKLAGVGEEGAEDRVRRRPMIRCGDPCKDLPKEKKKISQTFTE